MLANPSTEYQRPGQRSATRRSQKIHIRKSHPSLVITSFIDYESCCRSVEDITKLGPRANGMVCRPGQ
jgi:hypothetical protein